MHPEAREELRRSLKLSVLEYANYVGVTEACLEFDVPRSTFYRWKQTNEYQRRSGLYRNKSIAHHHPCKALAEAVGKNIRFAQHLSNERLADRYHGI